MEINVSDIFKELVDVNNQLQTISYFIVSDLKLRGVEGLYTLRLLIRFVSPVTVHN